eukprot:3993546-Amphidinium_carterae.2
MIRTYLCSSVIGRSHFGSRALKSGIHHFSLIAYRGRTGNALSLELCLQRCFLRDWAPPFSFEIGRSIDQLEVMLALHKRQCEPQLQLLAATVVATGVYAPLGSLCWLDLLVSNILHLQQKAKDMVKLDVGHTQRSTCAADAAPGSSTSPIRYTVSRAVLSGCASAWRRSTETVTARTERSLPPLELAAQLC